MPLQLCYYDAVQKMSRSNQHFYITGVAGFIGSAILKRLLELGQTAEGFDFATGYLKNLEFLKTQKGFAKRYKHHFVDLSLINCGENIFKNKDAVVIHLAALGSAPRSIKYPELSCKNNLLSFLNVLEMCRKNKQLLIYASSSSAVNCLSPYGATKSACDRLAYSYFKSYNFVSIPLRFFNIFGPGQLMTGDYAPAIGKWIHQAKTGATPTIYGKCFRDFTYIENAVQAIILASMARLNTFNIFDISHGVSVDTKNILKYILGATGSKVKPERAPYRLGDVAESEGDITPAERALGYRPSVSVYEGIDKYIDWYEQNDIENKIELYKS